MGIIIPPIPGPFGDDVLACNPPGETPFLYYVVFGGIEKGALWNSLIHPLPPNHTFRLEQLNFPTILWSFIGTVLKVTYDPNQPFIGGSLIDCRNTIPPFDRFIPFTQTGAGCQTIFSNSLTEPPNKIFKNGTCPIYSTA